MDRLKRAALVVGVDYYTYLPKLKGCVADAQAIATLLKTNFGGIRNFYVTERTASSRRQSVGRSQLKRDVANLFDNDNGIGIALFYFAGHGHVERGRAYILSSDSRDGDDGFALADLMTIVNGSRVPNRIVILDSCFAGGAGARPDAHWSEIAEGVTVLTASTARQFALAQPDGGVFTRLLVHALEGGASDLLGYVTPGSAYACIDQSLGSWEQRPVFKTNVKSFVPLRKAAPPIELSELLQLTEFFPDADQEFPLDPSFEPSSATAVKANKARFAILQNYVRVNLVVPVGAKHMYFAAMKSKSCKLTILGRHYHRLVSEGRIEG